MRNEAPAGPVTVLQIGEGNFLRGFFDWMIHVCRQQGLYQGTVAVTQSRVTGKDKLEQLQQQEGQYTLAICGIDAGEVVEGREVIGVFSEIVNPYVEWDRFIEIACSPDLQVVVSNTTEAGLVYIKERKDQHPIHSFPGKVAYLLWQRYLAFQGNPCKGLVFLPCELLESNGNVLLEIVLRHADDWGLPEDCKKWIRKHNRFLNSLVDRIVPGYPDEQQAERWFDEWGYKDPLLTIAEPYHLWAIETETDLEELLPFRRAGLNVHWTTSLEPFQKQKVRVLNGAHTWMAMTGLLHDIQEVGQFIEHSSFGPGVKELVMEDILPTLPYPLPILQQYVYDVFNRFSNPYIHHRLSDIAMNGISKFKARLLPTIGAYAELRDPVPTRLVFGMASLLRYYKVSPQRDGDFVGTTFSGNVYKVRDETATLDRLSEHWTRLGNGRLTVQAWVKEILKDTSLWGQDVSEWSDLAARVAEWIQLWEGCREA